MCPPPVPWLVKQLLLINHHGDEGHRGRDALREGPHRALRNGCSCCADTRSPRQDRRQQQLWEAMPPFRPLQLRPPDPDPQHLHEASGVQMGPALLSLPPSSWTVSEGSANACENTHLSPDPPGPWVCGLSVPMSVFDHCLNKVKHHAWSS